MRFTVPQFIEHEAKIVGPLTFRQFIFIGIAAAICFFLYFTVSFTVFLIACLFLGGVALALAFVRVGGKSLPAILAHFLKFNIAPKIYIWRKVKAKTKLFQQQFLKRPIDREKIDELPLKIAAQSRLKKIKNEIETKSK